METDINSGLTNIHMSGLKQRKLVFKKFNFKFRRCYYVIIFHLNVIYKSNQNKLICEDLPHGRNMGSTENATISNLYKIDFSTLK